MRSTLRVVLGWVVGCSVGWSEPAAAWDNDAHYALVYYLATRIGYTPQQTHQVASAAVDIDWDPLTEPLQVGNVVSWNGDAQTPRVLFHAFMDTRTYEKVYQARVDAGDAPTRAKRLAIDAAADQRDQYQKWFFKHVVGNGNCGVYIHFYQDIFSHGKYWSWAGHPEMGHGPDFLSYLPKASRDMLQGTIAELQRWMHLCLPREPRTPNADEAARLLDRLIAVNPYNSWENRYFSFNMAGRGVPDESLARDEVRKVIGGLSIPDPLKYTFDKIGDSASDQWKVADCVPPTGVLRVKVLDEANGDPLTGAKVEVFLAGSNTVQHTAQTANGLADFAAIAGGAGQVNVRASLKGYRSSNLVSAKIENLPDEPPAVAVVRLQRGEDAKPDTGAKRTVWVLQTGYPKMEGTSFVPGRSDNHFVGGRWELNLPNSPDGPLYGLMECTGWSANHVTVRTVAKYSGKQHDRQFTYRWDGAVPRVIVPGETKLARQATGTATGEGRVGEPVAYSRARFAIGIGPSSYVGQKWDDAGAAELGLLGDCDYRPTREHRGSSTAGYQGDWRTLPNGRTRDKAFFSVAAMCHLATPFAGQGRGFTMDGSIRVWWDYEPKELTAAQIRELQSGGDLQPTDQPQPNFQGGPAIDTPLTRPTQTDYRGQHDRTGPPAGPGYKVLQMSAGSAVSIGGKPAQELTEGADIPAGYVLYWRNPGTKVLVIRFPDGTEMSLMPGSEAQVSPARVIILVNGGFDFDNSRATDKRPYDVVTPNAGVSNDGTIYSVRYDARDKQTKVAVKEGSVKVTSAAAGQQPKQLGAGQETTVGAGGPSVEQPTTPGGPGEPPKPPATREATADVDRDKIIVCRRYNRTTMEPEGKADVFRMVPRLMAGYEFGKQAPRTEITIVWRRQGAEYARTTMIVADERAGTFWAPFGDENGHPLPPGPYQVVVMIGGKVVASRSFSIRP